jgi:hypothetical protein
MRPTVWQSLGRDLDPTNPMRPKEMSSARDLTDRCHRGSSGDVDPSTSLITQRSLVQIQPAQPDKSDVGNQAG